MFETIEAEISPGMSTADTVALAQHAEAVGFDRLDAIDAALARSTG